MIPFDSPNNIRYSFYSYLSSKDDKPYSATFGQISSKSNEAFSNYAQKTSFFDNNPRIKIFFKKNTSLSSHNQVATLCQKSKQSYEPFSRSLPNERTNGRTDGRELIGPNRSAGDQKSSKSDARFQRYRLKRPFFSQKGGFWVKKPP